MKQCRQAQQGFSLIELIFVIAVALIITAGALMQFVPVVKNARAENALQTTLSQMRNARGLAIDQRRQYRLSFVAPGTIQLDQVVVDPVTGIQSYLLASTIDLPTDTQFIAITGIPTAGSGTPDNLPTTGAAIDFGVDYGGAKTRIFFQPDGRALDNAGRLNNGVVYMARPGELMSSRAVSVLGATGRLKGWRLIDKGAGQSGMDRMMSHVQVLRSRRPARSKRSAGFSLIEVIIAVVILSVGLMALLAVFASGGLGHQVLARRSDRQAKGARGAGRRVQLRATILSIAFTDIQNVSNGGIFNDGFQPLYLPGANGITGTAQDTTTLDTMNLPGPDGKLGTADDVTVPLVNFKRQILISPITNADGTHQSRLAKHRRHRADCTVPDVGRATT